jgi:type 1 glutamine amidotransferase
MIRKMLLISCAFASLGFAQAEVKPLKVLLVIGGCCHDYGKQQFILSEGIEARVNCQVTIEYTDDRSTKPNFAIYKDPNWAKAYDVVIHDECAADVTDKTIIDNIVNAHKNGVPAVNLHCAMHSYRSGKFQQPMSPDAPEAAWFNMLGLQSSGHGPQKPIEITYTAKDHPVVKGLSDWTTINEELYNNVHGIEGNFKNWPTAKPLAEGKQDGGTQPGKNHAVIVWTNEFGDKKTKIFSTTLGHNNATVGDERFLNLVCRGLLWSCGKLDDKGNIAEGYVSKKAK